jgi:hypothetical protein
LGAAAVVGPSLPAFCLSSPSLDKGAVALFWRTVTTVCLGGFRRRMSLF